MSKDNEHDETKYEIEIRSDGILCVRTIVQSEAEAIKFSQFGARLLDIMSLGSIIEEIETYCKIIDGYLILEKSDGLPDDLRLAATTAVRYPKGLPDKVVQENLGIKPNSRKGYINGPTKRTSKYLSYDKKAKFVHITPDGIKWVLTELKAKETKDKQTPASNKE